MWHELWPWFLESGNQKLLLAILAALVIGFIVGHLSRSQGGAHGKSNTSKGDQSFFKGIQYILSNDHDQAIEEFTKSVQVNSDTIETYVALGNLFRSKGEIGRAIRIRQSIILRTNIEEQIKMGALFDLGLDFRKGGILNRALDIFLELHKKQPSDLKTVEEIEKIYEELKDWATAFNYRQKIKRLKKGNHDHILAHHQTEMGKAHQEKGETSKAKACFTKAISIDKNCIDSYLHLGDHYFSKQEYGKAIDTWKELVNVAPQYTFLAYRRLEGAYTKMQNLEPVENFLKECAELNSDAFTHLALARYLYNKQDCEGALQELGSALELDPNFLEASKFKGEILIDQEMTDEALEAFRDLIPQLNVPYLKFQCSNCGFRPAELQWQCPQCKNWDTIDFEDTGRLDSAAPRQVSTSSEQTFQQDAEETG